MSVSFIIPLFNCLPLTQAMLASLQATLPASLEHEIIFVDDGSTDGTRDWLKSLADPRIRSVLNEQNLGYAAANNRGAASAGSEFLVLLNNDLILTPRWLDEMFAVHRSLSQPGLVGNVQLNARTGAIDHTGIFINAKGKPEHDRERPAFSTRKIVPALTGACMLIERRRWVELGGFDEQFVNGCEDIDLCFRAAASGCTHAVALRSVIRHHVSASPGRKRRDEMNTYLLTRRWRRELAVTGARAWSWHYLTRELSAAEARPSLGAAWAILAYAFGARVTPPPATLDGVATAIDRELLRWRAMFG